MTETTPPPTPESDPIRQKLVALVERCQKVMAHAWMIRTFVKHSDEVEDFPDLNEMARTIFDAFRAVETQVDDPVSYFRTVRKKIGKLRSVGLFNFIFTTCRFFNRTYTLIKAYVELLLLESGTNFV